MLAKTGHPTTAKQMLKEIKRFFNNASTPEAKQLWDVLTALRGPDFEDAFNKAKCSTTAIIRYKVLGKAMHRLAASTALDSSIRLEERLSIEGVHHHFRNHASNAFKALGLKWDKANGTIVPLR